VLLGGVLGVMYTSGTGGWFLQMSVCLGWSPLGNPG